MNRQPLQWLNRVNATPHGTTNEIPFERLRQENLKPITAIPAYRLRREEYRKISREAYISYLGNRYSVPYRYAGRELRSGTSRRPDDHPAGTRSYLFAYRRPRTCPAIREKKHFRPSRRGHAMQFVVQSGLTAALYDGSSAGRAPATSCL